MKTDALLNAYIDMNLLVLAAALLWRVLRVALRHSRLSSAYTPQLQLLNGMALLLVVSPIFILALKVIGFGQPPPFLMYWWLSICRAISTCLQRNLKP